MKIKSFHKRHREPAWEPELNFKAGAPFQNFLREKGGIYFIFFLTFAQFYIHMHVNVCLLEMCFDTRIIH